MKALLIMPEFFDYPQVICEELRRMGYEVDYFNDRPSNKGVIKAVIRIKKDLIKKYIRMYFDDIMKNVRSKKYNVVILISGQSLSFSEEMIAELKSAQPQAKFVLYQWDSIKNFPSIQNHQKYFERCYSFDKDDVDKNKKLVFLPLFYSARYENIGKQKNKQSLYDFCFVGTAHPKKYKFIKVMSEQLKAVYPRQFIYFFFPSRLVYFYRKLKNVEFRKARYREFNFEPISGKNMDELILKSKCILDSAQDGQIGLTIRVIEALGSKKKLITTNPDVKNYDFFREENIYVYNGEFDYKSTFFRETYVELPVEIYEKYSLRTWLNILINE